MCFAPQRRPIFGHPHLQTWSEPLKKIHFEMCFVPQGRAFVRHPTFQKWSEHGVFCTIWLGNLLRATTTCTFSTSDLPKVIRTWCFDVFWAFWLGMCFVPQSRALFPSHLARCLRTRHFSEPTFRPSRPTNHWKNTALHNFPNSSRTCIFFLLTLSLSFFFCSPLFFSSTLLWCLTSKLPLTRYN